MLAGLGWLGWQVTTRRWQKERERLSVVLRIHRQVMRCELRANRPPCRAAAPPVGADASAAAALAGVQRWQDAHRGASSAASATSPQAAAPSCAVGMVKVAGCTGGAVGCAGGPLVDAETAICEELKPWLLSAASGAAAPAEVGARLEFCRQLLMRPENFPDASFLKLIATVCSHLEELSERVAGAVRTCAVELGRLIALGRQMVDISMPILALALTDVVGDGELPRLTADYLCTSFAPGHQADILTPLWQSEAGSILRALLETPHFHELRGQSVAATRPAGRRSAVQGVKEKVLVTKHGCAGGLGWLDKVNVSGSLNASGSFHGSGLCDLFQTPASEKLLDEYYLDLFTALDDFIKFLSMLLVYRRLANTAGDAGMCRLRAGLHHLLSELEASCVQVRRMAAKISFEAKGAAAKLASLGQRQSHRRTLWIERLRVVDESAFDKAFQTALETIQELRFLSSAARMPELRRACAQSVQELGDIMASPEFRLRCSHAPPQVALPYFADEDTSGGVGLPALPAAARAALTNALGHGDVDFVSAEVLYRSGAETAALEALDLAALPAAPPAPPAPPAPGPEDSAAALGRAAEEPSPKLELRLASEKEESDFYEKLLMTVLPRFGGGDDATMMRESMSRDQAAQLLACAEIGDELVQEALRRELGSRAGFVDGAGLQRLGRIVALKQSGADSAMQGDAWLLPRLQGFMWDGRRVRCVE